MQTQVISPAVLYQVLSLPIADMFHIVSVCILPVSYLNCLTHSMCKVIMIPSRSSSNASNIISVVVEHKIMQDNLFQMIFTH